VTGIELERRTCVSRSTLVRSRERPRFSTEAARFGSAEKSARGTFSRDFSHDA